HSEPTQHPDHIAELTSSPADAHSQADTFHEALFLERTYASRAVHERIARRIDELTHHFSNLHSARTPVPSSASPSYNKIKCRPAIFSGLEIMRSEGAYLEMAPADAAANDVPSGNNAKASGGGRRGSSKLQPSPERARLRARSSQRHQSRPLSSRSTVPAGPSPPRRCLSRRCLSSRGAVSACPTSSTPRPRIPPSLAPTNLSAPIGGVSDAVSSARPGSPPTRGG
ncbi:hypothetical protein OC844_006218, partial [Tilletia horrida]